MALAGSELKRLYAVGSENGGDGDAFVREEREAMERLYAVGSENGGDGDAFVREEREAMDVVLQALDGEHMS